MPRSESLSLGIELNDREVRAVLVDLAGETPSVRTARVVPLPDGAIASGAIGDFEAVVHALRELVRPLRLGPATPTFVGISSALVVTRNLTIPPCDDWEIPTLVEGEMEHQGLWVEGGPLETIVFPRRANAPAHGMRSVSVVLADPAMVRTTIAAVESAGLKVSALETSQAGKLRAAALALPYSAATFFLVMGPHVTGVSYFDGPDLVANRRIEVGSTTLFRPAGPSGEGIGAPLRVDHATIDRLAIESLQMMEFVQRESAGEIESVRIYAIEPELEMLAPMLERRFGIPTTFSPPPAELDDIRYSVAFGLAVREFPGPFNVPKLDLAAKLRQQSDDKESKRNLAGSMLASGLALVVGLVAFVCYSRLIASLGEHSRRATNQLHDLRGKIDSVRSARESGDLLYRTLRHEGVPLGSVMDDVVVGLDAGVRLKSVGVGKDYHVRIEGEAKDEAALGRATQRLQASTVLKNVCLVGLDRSATPGRVPLSFEIDATTPAADGAETEARS